MIVNELYKTFSKCFEIHNFIQNFKIYLHLPPKNAFKKVPHGRLKVKPMQNSNPRLASLPFNQLSYAESYQIIISEIK